jgi:spermidine/putrescine-binding protein
MIEKMAKEGMLQKIEFNEDGDYLKYLSPYIYDTFNKITWEENGETVSLHDYAGCYMWGTLGLTYNPEFVDGEDMESWASLWEGKYNNVSTIKDSIRDSYFIALAYVYQDELLAAKEKYALDGNSALYNATISEIFNRTDKESIDKVEKALLDLKEKLYGFEVDAGKADILTGKIDVNFAWSGDAVYSIYQGLYNEETEEVLENPVYLGYAVPEEGSNVWFDGWCVPKNSQNVELAVKFIEFLSNPEIVVRNMSYIGYTSGIGGEAVFDNAVDWYGVCTLVESEISEDEYNALTEEDLEYYEKTADGKIYEYVYAEEIDGLIVGNDQDGYSANITYFDEETEEIYQEETEIFKADLSYFFGEGDWAIFTDTIGRQFTAQYPTEDIISRCVVMNCYDEEANGRVTLMWERVKGFTFPVYLLIIFTCLLVLLIVFIVLYKNKEKIFKNKQIKHKENKFRKIYKVVKIEKIN